MAPVWRVSLPVSRFCIRTGYLSATPGLYRFDEAMEPISTAFTSAAGRAAGTLATKAFQRGGRVRLGGREERRFVYAHFQVCAIRMYDQRQELVLSHSWMDGLAFFYFAIKRARRANEFLRDLQVATAELSLVGNEGPVAAGARLYNASLAPDPFLGVKHSKNVAAAREFNTALVIFVQACKEDLWYLPQWWQVWRPAWWGVRWRSYRSRGVEKKRIKEERKARVAMTKTAGR
ncbi:MULTISPECIES: hypothetical protein [unclassified Streptomyces]|uniref:hypothetical protein n=1 Tax=unclassified Streptomyces TaxID=2593676 RepID=UPI001EEFC675|nr:MULTISPECIES: hypothetical protein [unclassified Streptomyces]